MVNQVVLTGEWWPECPVSMCGTHLQLCNSPHQHTKLHKWCANFSIFAILVVGLFFFAIECLNSLIFGQLSGSDRWRWPDCPVSMCGTHLQPCNSPHQHTKLHKRCANFSIFAILVVELFFSCNWVFELPFYLF